MAERDDYALNAETAQQTVPAPQLPWQVPQPRERHPIALVGAGGISFAHLDAYRSHGFEVAAIMSRDIDKARKAQQEFFPQARITTDFHSLLDDPEITVLDLTPHPGDRLPLMEAAIAAGKHVLSQKPFVEDLATGERLAEMARAKGVRLTVNQNGRWAPHMAWMRAAVRAGLIGELRGVHCSLHWDHTWVKDTPFEEIDDLVLYDFGIHWFDFVTSLTGQLAQRVQAQALRVPSAGVKPPMLGSVLMDFGTAQSSLVFDAATPFGPSDSTCITGSKGSLIARGPNLGQQQVELHTEAGIARPQLDGAWFNDGFAGAMGALLCAIEEDAEPENGAAQNLVSLANCFAALEAARSGAPQVAGQIRARPPL